VTEKRNPEPCRGNSDQGDGKLIEGGRLSWRRGNSILRLEPGSKTTNYRYLRKREVGGDSV